MEFRIATASDAEDIAKLHCDNWRENYQDVLDSEYLAGPIDQERRRHWSSFLSIASENDQVVVACEQSRIIGFVCVQRQEGSTWGTYIENLHVAASERGRGIGKMLLQAAAQWSRDRAPDDGLYLWVFEANADAIRFYERMKGKLVERSFSEIPASNGAPRFRVWWKRAQELICDEPKRE
jgi:ribosomal protein S18 acetylase RimI-like enzyme